MLTLLHLAIQDWLKMYTKPCASPDSSIGYRVSFWLYHIMQIQLSPNIMSRCSSRFAPLAAAVNLCLTLNNYFF